MFQGLYNKVDELKNLDQEKIKAGVYGKCRDARAIIQKIKEICQDLRIEIIGYYHEKEDKKKQK